MQKMEILTLGAFFWSIMCTKSLHKVKKAFTNRWKTSFNEGDDVVIGLYYQKWGNNESSYVLLKYSHLVYVYSHLVRVIKFLMPLNNHRMTGNDFMYELPGDILQGINEVIVVLEVDEYISIVTCVQLFIFLHFIL